MKIMTPSISIKVVINSKNTISNNELITAGGVEEVGIINLKPNLSR